MDNYGTNIVLEIMELIGKGERDWVEEERNGEVCGGEEEEG